MVGSFEYRVSIILLIRMKSRNCQKLFGSSTRYKYPKLPLEINNNRSFVGSRLMRTSIKIHARGDGIARVEGTCGLTGMINSRGYAPRTLIPIPYDGNAKSISNITFGESNFISLKQCRFNSLRMELPPDKKNFIIDDEL